MEIKKTLKIIGATIAGVFIAIMSWVLNNIINHRRNYNASHENQLKEDIKNSKKETNDAAENLNNAAGQVNEATQKLEQKLEETEQKEKDNIQQNGTSESRIEDLESAGVIKRVKKNA